MRIAPHVYPTRDTKEDRTSEKKREVKSVVNALIIEDYTRNEKNIEINEHGFLTRRSKVQILPPPPVYLHRIAKFYIILLYFPPPYTPSTFAIFLPSGIQSS